jgi:ATP-dependent RNA helicase DeaD
MRKGVDILVGTTGRVMDHLNKGSIKDFSEMKALVLDEAD